MTPEQIAIAVLAAIVIGAVLYFKKNPAALTKAETATKADLQSLESNLKQHVTTTAQTQTPVVVNVTPAPVVAPAAPPAPVATPVIAAPVATVVPEPTNPFAHGGVPILPTVGPHGLPLDVRGNEIQSTVAVDPATVAPVNGGTFRPDVKNGGSATSVQFPLDGSPKTAHFAEAIGYFTAVLDGFGALTDGGQFTAPAGTYTVTIHVPIGNPNSTTGTTRCAVALQ